MEWTQLNRYGKKRKWWVDSPIIDKQECCAWRTLKSHPLQLFGGCQSARCICRRYALLLVDLSKLKTVTIQTTLKRLTLKRRRMTLKTERAWTHSMRCSCMVIVDSWMTWIYRVVQKIDTQFHFWDNFSNSAPILTVLSLLQAEIYGA